MGNNINTPHAVILGEFLAKLACNSGGYTFYIEDTTKINARHSVAHEPGDTLTVTWDRDVSLMATGPHLNAGWKCVAEISLNVIGQAAWDPVTVLVDPSMPFVLGTIITDAFAAFQSERETNGHS